MLYFFGYLLLSSLFFFVTFLILGRLVIRLVKKKERRSWWLFVIIFSPFLTYIFYYHVFLLYLDLPSALKNTTQTATGTVTQVYHASGSIDFKLDNTVYKRNPWTFNPKDNTSYQVEYLPNSRFVIQFEQLP